MNNLSKKLLFDIIRSEICENLECSDALISASREDIDKLCKLSVGHDLLHIVASAFLKNKIPNVDIEKADELQRAWSLSIYRYEHQEYELSRICALFEEEKVDFIPLKGPILRKYYPQPWLRTSCDIDILVKKEELERATRLLVEKLNYRECGMGEHDISLYSENDIHLELHFTLQGNSEAADAVLSRVWDNAFLYEGYSYRYNISDEMIYFYHIAHMATHIIYGGCGIRPYIDLWFLDKNGWTNSKVNDLLIEGELLRFSECARKLSRIWFDGEDYDTLSKKLEGYVLYGGVYGRSDNQKLVYRAKKHSELKYILSRIFLPYKILKNMYPIIKKHKVLTPVFEVIRWFGIIFKEKRNHLRREFSLSKEEVQDFSDFVDDLGI